MSQIISMYSVVISNEFHCERMMIINEMGIMICITSSMAVRTSNILPTISHYFFKRNFFTWIQISVKFAYFKTPVHYDPILVELLVEPKIDHFV